MDEQSNQILVLLGQWVRQVRASSMDQSDLATLVGVGRMTISALERGKPVNTEVMAKVLEVLALTAPLQQCIVEQIELSDEQRSQLAKKPAPHPSPRSSAQPSPPIISPSNNDGTDN